MRENEKIETKRSYGEKERVIKVGDWRIMERKKGGRRKRRKEKRHEKERVRDKFKTYAYIRV